MKIRKRKRSRATRPSVPARLELIERESQLTLELQADGSESPSFRMVAYTGAAIRVWWSRHPVVIDLTKMKIPRRSIPIRALHDPLQGVGHSTRVFVDGGRQLLAEGVISRDTEAAREVIASSKKGFPWQASVGVSILKMDDVESDIVLSVNGRNFRGPMHVVRDSELAEISFVDLGADSRTSAAVKASEENAMKKKRLVASTVEVEAEGDVGTDEGADTEEQTTESQVDDEEGNGDSGESHEDVPASVRAKAVVQSAGDDEIKNLRVKTAGEVKRIAAIRKICAGSEVPAGLEARAIEEGWTEEKTELEKLRATRPKVTAVQTGREESISGLVLEAAACQSARMPNLEKAYDAQTLDIAHKRFRSCLGLQELLLQAAWANGYHGRSFKADPRSILRHAFGREVQAAAFSTIDIGGILSNVANKFLLDGFFNVEASWRSVTAIKPVSDFKTVTSYRLVGKDQYEKIAPGGELKHGTLDDESFTNKADTYGLLLSVDRRDIINDDLGAISTVPRKLGRGAGLKINDVFWTVFLNNASFFASGNNNYFSGAATNLSINSLTTAEQMFMDMVDVDGKPIGIMPKILLVPTALSAIAAQIFKSLELRDTTASTKYPVANPHQGKFPVIVSRYLGNSTYTGNSDVAWYLLADPLDLAVVETAFLNGQESPTIETSEADFNVLGIQMRGFHDFGVALQDPKGGVKSKGEA